MIFRRISYLCGKRWYSKESATKTALYDFHVTHGGKMVDFAGYLLPIQYNMGIPESHKHTRSKASLFDVSHMLQTTIRGKDRIRFIESIATADVEGLKVGSGCLSLFTDHETGGILDDLIITKYTDHLSIVTNASRRDSDMKLMLKAWESISSTGGDVSLHFEKNLSLIALQGPKAAAVLSSVTEIPLNHFYFMQSMEMDVCGKQCCVSRAGYTGEDGFEISIDSSDVETVAEKLVSMPDVELAGLGVRDSLRLEAGLCLYGSDIDIKTTPTAAGLMWTIGKRRKANKDFPGAEIILNQKPKEKRVGLISRRSGPPVRGGASVMDKYGEFIGHVTSGCPSPSLGTSIAMAYVPTEYSIGDYVYAMVRGKKVEMQVTRMPFVRTNYYTENKKK
ncbi:aminomethyltransferase, mitochondrial isoform X1 [Halyomorpha halys]|uniref:aminomethyltransferase, mitochondrial isoform X1 n=2 Tax=Halyomorpha halys TaxID=286706 RepID=UPI0006D4C8D4|nr:aminomethyltransferase, mitochondrial isoform X1 [Halyomorpha halys]